MVVAAVSWLKFTVTVTVVGLDGLLSLSELAVTVGLAGGIVGVGGALGELTVGVPSTS